MHVVCGIEIELGTPGQLTVNVAISTTSGRVEWANHIALSPEINPYLFQKSFNVKSEN